MSNDYEVGYKKPPKETQFAKGVSGNPSGRAGLDKSRVATTEDRRKIVLKEANRIVQIKTSEGQESVSMLEALIKTLFKDSLTGNKNSLKHLVYWLDKSFEEGNEKLNERRKEANKIMDLMELVQPGILGTKKLDINDLINRLMLVLNTDAEEDLENTVTLYFEEKIPQKED